MRLLIGASIVAMVATFPAMAATIEVNPGQSIEAALKRARPGDTVAVRAGTYNESIYVKMTGVKLISADGVGAAHIVSNGTPLFIQGGRGNEIRGFKLTGGSRGNGLQVGGTVRNFAEDYVIADNIITNAGLDGIKVHQASGFTIEGNVIEKAGTGNGRNFDGGIDFVAVQDSVLEGNSILRTGGNSCLMLKGGSTGNEVTGNSFAGCKDAIHVGGKTMSKYMAPGSSGKEAYGNTITGNNLCGGKSNIYMFSGERRRQDNTIKDNSCNGSSDGWDMVGNEPDRPALPTRDGVPMQPLPDNSVAKAEYEKHLVSLDGARKTLGKATATKLPSMSMEDMRKEMQAKNDANCT